MLLLISACSPQGSSELAETPPNTTATISCEDHIDEVASLSADFSQIGPRAAFTRSSSEFGVRQGDIGSGTEDLTFTKLALLVREDAEFSIRIVSPPDALMSWGSADPPPPDTRLDRGICDQSSGQWLVYAGGVWVGSPTCVVFHVESDGETSVVSHPIGLAADQSECDGL